MNWIGTHRVSKGGTLVQRVRNSFLFYHSPRRLISSSSFSCCYSSALIYLRTSSDYWAITINRLRGNCRWYTCAQQKHLIRYASACDELGKRVQIHLTISRDSQSSPFIQSNSLSPTHPLSLPLTELAGGKRRRRWYHKLSGRPRGLVYLKNPFEIESAWGQTEDWASEWQT